MSRLVVYLVHGTWPFGLFRKERGNQPPAWFHLGSDFCTAITEELNEQVEIRSFSWSGSNSFSARGAAATRFADQLSEDLSQAEDDCRFIVIAHSHGGTVSANAIAMLSARGNPSIGRISTLICMATPFAYWTISNVSHRKVFVSATNWLAVGALAALFALALPWFVIEFQLTFGLAFLTIGYSLGIIRPIRRALKPQKVYDDYPQSVELPAHLRIHILRAPQDEASMAIGFAQVLQAITREFYKLTDPAYLVTSIPRALIAGLAIGPAITAAGMYLASIILPDVGNLNAIYVVGLAIAGGIAASLFLTCYALMAASVGYWRYRMWMTRGIEVEVAPLGTWSTIHVLWMDPADDAQGLRHSLHERPDVRKAIWSFLKHLQDG